MKTPLWMALAIAGVPMIAMAAADFSGSWVRDSAKSDRDPYPLYWLTRGGGETGGGQANAEYVITVRQDAKGVQVTDPQRPLRTYTLDGKAHVAPTDTGMTKATTTANVQDDKLMVITTQPYGGMPGNVTLTTHEVWSLSPDGKVLTITTTRDAPAMKQTLKAIYTRK